MVGIQTRGVKWGQRTVRWLVKTWFEALVELGLNESNESGQRVLLHCRLYSEGGVDLVYFFEERREFEHFRVASL